MSDHSSKIQAWLPEPLSDEVRRSEGRDVRSRWRVRNRARLDGDRELHRHRQRLRSGAPIQFARRRSHDEPLKRRRS